MKSCESYEMHISALIDGEASRADTCAILDHLPTCEPCQVFYRDCRALQDVADSLPAESELETQLVHEREQSSAQTGTSTRIVHFSRRPRWVWAAAASIAVLFAAGGIWLPRLNGEAPGARTIDLSKEHPSEPMNDERFMEISVALFHADPVYPRTMIEILKRFERHRGLDESSIDVATITSESDQLRATRERDDGEMRRNDEATPTP